MHGKNCFHSFVIHVFGGGRHSWGDVRNAGVAWCVNDSTWHTCWWRVKTAVESKCVINPQFYLNQQVVFKRQYNRTDACILCKSLLHKDKKNHTWGSFSHASRRCHSPQRMFLCVQSVLTHWGRDKIAAISQTTFSNAFSSLKMCEFWLKFHWSLFLNVNQKYSNIGSDNDLAPTRRQAIIWTNDV